jgi:hypothetical protein
MRSPGKMLLQNLQLVIGKRYESEEPRPRRNRPMLSVMLDEFAPFGYRNFAQILQTARGTNTAFLFSMQDRMAQRCRLAASGGDRGRVRAQRLEARLGTWPGPKY